MAITFDTTNKGNLITFNNDNLTITATQGNYARASVPLMSDHTYFEIKYNSFVGSDALMIGVVSGNANLTTDTIMAVGTTANARLYFSNNGFKYDGKGSTYGGATYGSTFTIGDYIGVYTNTKENSIAFYKNGIYQGIAFLDINTLDGDNIHAVIGSGSSTVGHTVSATLNFGDNPFHYFPNNLPREVRAYNQKLIKSFVTINNNCEKYGSLDNNTLISLPNNSTKNMILHGIEQGKEVQLDVPFTKINHVNESPVDGVRGKVFKQDISIINTLNIKEVRDSKSFKPINNWYGIKMTSNTAPSPLVASASTVYSNYFPFKAFNGTNVDSNDCWVSDSKTDGWLQIDFGDRKKINTISITSRKHTDNSPIENSPKDFNIEASNNGIDFTVLSSLRNINDWGPDTKKTFSFTNENSYRFFRIHVLSNNGGISVIIALITFGYKREVI